MERRQKKPLGMSLAPIALPDLTTQSAIEKVFIRHEKKELCRIQIEEKDKRDFDKKVSEKTQQIIHYIFLFQMIRDIYQFQMRKDDKPKERNGRTRTTRTKTGAQVPGPLKDDKPLVQKSELKREEPFSRELRLKNERKLVEVKTMANPKVEPKEPEELVQEKVKLVEVHEYLNELLGKALRKDGENQKGVEGAQALERQVNLLRSQVNAERKSANVPSDTDSDTEVGSALRNPNAPIQQSLAPNQAENELSEKTKMIFVSIDLLLQQKQAREQKCNK